MKSQSVFNSDFYYDYGKANESVKKTRFLLATTVMVTNSNQS